MMIRILPIIGLLLLIPLIAMQLTNEVNWSFFDFIIMGALLTIIGLLIGIILQKVKNSKNRLILIVTIIMMFFLIWAELAVGLFGTIFAGDQISNHHPINIKPHECGAYLDM
jgi:cytochrome bd-type quinol oxidase subunit 2